MACIGVIIAGGRTLLRPIYRRIADMGNADVFAALTLLVVLGTSVLTQIAGLSLALGAFLARAPAPSAPGCQPAPVQRPRGVRGIAEMQACAVRDLKPALHGPRCVPGGLASALLRSDCQA